MSRHLFVGMDDESRARRSLVFTVIVVVVLLCAALGGSFFVGYETRGFHEHAKRKAAAEAPKRAAPATFVPWLKCDKDEYGRICRARERMTKVGPT